jgi:hypothetical protein
MFQLRAICRLVTKFRASVTARPLVRSGAGRGFHVIQSSSDSPQLKQDQSPWSRPFPGADGGATAPVSVRTVERELPDVTGFLVVVLVTLGLFVVPVGATLMQGPAIVASLFSR